MKSILPLAAASLLLAGGACTPSHSASTAPTTSPAFVSVKTVALRGDEAGRQPLLGAIVGPDGTVYASMKDGLYRVQLDGSYTLASRTDACGSRELPSARASNGVCVQGGFIEQEMPRGTRRIPLARPDWSAADPRYATDSTVRTSVTRTENGDWHIVYGYARGVVTVRTSGAQSLHRVSGSAIIRSAAFLNDDAMMSDEDCNLIHLRHDIVQRVEKLECSAEPGVIAVGHAFWIMGTVPGALSRRGTDGSGGDWRLETDPLSVTVSPADGTVYVLTTDRERNPRNTLVLIPRASKPRILPLALHGGSNVVIDGMCRLWITVSLSHAFAVLKPPGTTSSDCRSAAPGRGRGA